MQRSKVLVVEDDRSLRSAILEYFESKDLAAYEAGTAQQCLNLCEQIHPEVALIDYLLPDGTVLDLLPKLKAIDPTMAVIVLTGHATIDLAVRVVKEGAEQFVPKPVHLDILFNVIKREIDNQRNRRKQLARKAEHSRYERDPFLGESVAIVHLKEIVNKLVGTDSPILIQGETGTGKGVLASWLHRSGRRADEAFVDLNCAGFSRELLESELFGHEKGAFTGAVSAKAGLFEVAHRGTVFLDEIGDLDLAIQPKLLKVLEDKRFRHVGDTRDRVVDIQLIAATHHSLSELVVQQRFRSDLFYRINTLTLRIPPLRERVDDIPLIAQRLLRQLESDLCRGPIELSAPAIEKMRRYPWPGNIRELRNVLERAALLCTGSCIGPQDLDFPMNAAAPLLPTGQSQASLIEVEQQHIATVLREAGGSVQQAAARLGIPRSTLYMKIKQFGLNVGKGPNSPETN